jgi:hypothetical protein
MADNSFLQQLSQWQNDPVASLAFGAANDVGRGALSSPYQLIDQLNAAERGMGIPVQPTTALQDFQSITGQPTNPWLYNMGAGNMMALGTGFGMPDVYLPNQYAGPTDLGAMTKMSNGDGTYTVNYGNQTWIEDTQGQRISLPPPNIPAAQWDQQQQQLQDQQANQYSHADPSNPYGFTQIPDPLQPGQMKWVPSSQAQQTQLSLPGDGLPYDVIGPGGNGGLNTIPRDLQYYQPPNQQNQGWNSPPYTSQDTFQPYGLFGTPISQYTGGSYFDPSGLIPPDNIYTGPQGYNGPMGWQGVNGPPQIAMNPGNNQAYLPNVSFENNTSPLWTGDQGGGTGGDWGTTG